MKNTIHIKGQRAAISFDPEINLFRGEFTGLNGGADFYAASEDELLAEGGKSLRVFMDGCREKQIEPLAATD